MVEAAASGCCLLLLLCTSYLSSLTVTNSWKCTKLHLRELRFSLIWLLDLNFRLRSNLLVVLLFIWRKSRKLTQKFPFTTFLSTFIHGKVGCVITRWFYTSFHYGNCLHSFPLFTTWHVSFWRLLWRGRAQNFLHAFCSEKSIFHYVHSKKVLTSVQEVLFWEYILELQKTLFALSSNVCLVF